MPRKSQIETKKRPAKNTGAARNNSKKRRPGKRKGKCAALMHKWGISARFVAGLTVIIALAVFGATLIHDQFASTTSREAQKEERGPKRMSIDRDSRQTFEQKTDARVRPRHEAGGPRETRKPVLPPPRGEQPGERRLPGVFASEEQIFEEQNNNRLEKAVRHVDNLLLEALDAQDIPYSIHMNDAQWREHAGEMYHFQRFLVLFQGDDGEKNQAAEGLRYFLNTKFRNSVPAASLITLTENRWLITIDGVTTHELLFAADQTKSERISGPNARLAILIDDIGENKAMLREFLALDIPMAFAVLPHSTHARECAHMITSAGHELLLHHPMEPERFPAVKPGPGAIYVKDSAARINAVLTDNMARVPGIKGINNHMGSRFTSNARSVSLFLRAMSGKGLFVLDSLTSPKSKLYNAARQMGIKAYRRDVFLDDASDKASILYELKKAARIAQSQGHALAIGHPRPETLAVLKEWLRNSASGITFSRLEDLEPGR